MRGRFSTELALELVKNVVERALLRQNEYVFFYQSYHLEFVSRCFSRPLHFCVAFRVLFELSFCYTNFAAAIAILISSFKSGNPWKIICVTF